LGELTVRVYLDSALLIYLVEDVPPYARPLETRLSAPDTVQVCSELSRLECRVKPLRDGQGALLAAFDSYFAEIIGELLPLSRQAIDEATELRARYSFRTPDAIHLAAAIVGGCDLFLTNDQRLNRCREIDVEVIGLANSR
jgi:predicted nucleic acid-binding protein